MLDATTDHKSIDNWDYVRYTIAWVKYGTCVADILSDTRRRHQS